MFELKVDRVCRVRAPTEDELPMPVDLDGFLDAASVVSTATGARPGDLLTPVVAAEAHALVMLGEPGLGKTTALRTIADRIRGRVGRLAWVDGSDLDSDTFDEEVGAPIGSLPLASEAESLIAAVDPVLTVVIDGLDESPMVHRLPRRLSLALSGRATSQLRLLIGCRTADLPPSLREVLDSAFKPCLFVDLAPLRRVDAVSLASSAGVEGQQLLDRAVEFGAASLAATPLSLQLLVQTFLETGELNQGPRWLFGQGVRRLLAETNPEHERPSTIEQRIAIAERIAAVLLLSGRRTVYTGADLRIRPTTDLRASVVCDGDEQTPSGPFRVTLDLVRDTLGSQLFSSRGDSRRAFGHSSHAAFLAARYLHRRRLPRRQLEGLFLVAGPDGSRSVPVPLRETAAWLAALDPDAGDLLAAADPQSLVGHDAYLDSGDLRSVVVASLLDRAEEFELGERAWLRSVRLSHPGLADQVQAVLENHDVQPEEWPDFARCRLALRLASDASAPRLTERLLRIVESAAWNSHLRSMAAAAALAGDRESAVPRLRDVLHGLQDREHARVADPDDELKGNLLDELWPQHMSTLDVLPFLVPRRSRSVIGGYWMFLRNFAARIRDEDLPSVVTWAASAVNDARIPNAPSDDDDDEDLDYDDVPLGSLDVTLLDALVDRTLASPQLELLVTDIARLIWPRFDRHEHPTLAVALDGDAEDARGKRRLLADALIRVRSSDGAFGNVDAFKLIQDWRPSIRFPVDNSEGAPSQRSTLLDANDFRWTLDRSQQLLADDDAPASRGMAIVAAMLFDRSDIAAIEVASQQRGTTNWETLASYFDAIPISGEAADRLREWRQMERRPVEDDEPADAAMLRDDLIRLFDRVSGGDVTEFWRLVWNLQFPPGRARGLVRRDDRLLEFPGVSILGSDAPTRLALAARAFLLSADDHADEWLGTDHYDQRAWAGFLALVLLDDRGELDSFPPAGLASWAGAALWFPSFSNETGERDRKARVLNRVAAAAPVRLAFLIPKFVRGELVRCSLASGIGLIDPSVHAAVMAAWLALLGELTGALLATSANSPATPGTPDDDLRLIEDCDRRVNAVAVYATLLENLARCDLTVGADLVVQLLGRATDEHARSLAATAVEVMVDIDPGSWGRFLPLVARDPELGRSVAQALASGHREVKLTACLAEVELATLYSWLTSISPTDGDRVQTGAHWVTPEEQARRLRDGVLTVIANRGTEASVQVLARLHEQFPLRPEVLSNLIRARIALFATAWVPPSPEEVQTLFADARRRLVRSSGELGILVEETLVAIGDEMIRAGEFLWDRQPSGRGDQRWWPKPEAALASFIAHDMELRLHGRGLAVHREVLVKATDPYGAGDKTDIMIEANIPADALSQATPSRFRVVIEVKCPWNDGILTDQRDQLVGRYLPEAQSGTGLFVVGWYPPELWSSGDYRLTKARRHTESELQTLLSAQAADLSAAGVSVKTVMLTVPRPTPNEMSGRS